MVQRQKNRHDKTIYIKQYFQTGGINYDEFKEDGEETSLFLLPERYADPDECDKLYRNGNPDNVGYWIPESLVKSIEN